MRIYFRNCPAIRSAICENFKWGCWLSSFVIRSELRASPKALTSVSRAIRRWALHHHSDKSLQDLAKMYNPYIEGWINYYGQFSPVGEPPPRGDTGCAATDDRHFGIPVGSHAVFHE